MREICVSFVRPSLADLEGARSENKTRIIKMTSLDGEYLLLGRKTEDFSNIFIQYGQGATRTMNITGGQGIQSADFIDGLRFGIESQHDFKLNVDLKVVKDHSEKRLLKLLSERRFSSYCWICGLMRTDTYAWVVNTTLSNSKPSVTCNISLPCESRVFSSIVTRPD